MGARRVEIAGILSHVPRDVRQDAPTRSRSDGVRLPHRSSQETSSAGRMSPSCLTRSGPFIAACPMSRSGTWSPTWPSRSSAQPTRPTRSRKRSHEYFEAGVDRVWVVYPGQQEVYVYASPTADSGPPARPGARRRRPDPRFPSSSGRCSRTTPSDRVGVSVIDLRPSRARDHAHDDRDPAIRLESPDRPLEPRDACRGLFRPRACAGCTRPTPASTRSSRSAWSCPERSSDVAAIVKIAAEEHVPIVPRGAATSLSGQTVGPAIVIDFSKYLNRIGIVDRDRHDGPRRAGRGARPAQCALEAAGPDVRARRLDQRSGDDRRDDRQQLGRGSLAPLRQDGRPRAVGRGRPGRRHDGDARPGPDERARRDLRSVGYGRAGPSRGARHGGRASSRRSATGFRRSCAGSAATTSTSSCRACRCGPRAGTKSPGSSTWRS